MPDQLTDLLHADADAVRVPAPDPAAVLARGRALRRRRRAGTALVAAAAVLAVGAGGVLVGDLLRTPAPAPPVAVADTAAAEAYAANGAWAIGDEVTIGGDETVTLDDTVYYLAQTSAGAVALLPGDGDGDARRLVLVRPDGTTADLGARVEAIELGAEVDAPYVTWLVPGDGTAEVHVWDVEADREVGGGDVPAPGLTGEYSVAPDLVGDALVVDDYAGSVRWLRWRTGEVLPTGQVPEKAAGVRRLSQEASADGMGDWIVVDVATGEVVRRVERGWESFASLSPDGTTLYLARTLEAGETAAVLDVGTGVEAPLDDVSFNATWTPDGSVLGAVAEGFSVCRADGCTLWRVDLDPTDRNWLLPDVANVG
ncbi:TolB family protein [Nocardioides zeae]|uniref:WD40 repeat domain-containing protein n=1 Tax=Nocardioides zeae TaxID=1457234 RepID=A0A6P0HN98_9ACTN|nr:hypothetical protein [Nocardioides zeae]NEN80169.1 hypothetical protein [Nocardioides zeae]